MFGQGDGHVRRVDARLLRRLNEIVREEHPRRARQQRMRWFRCWRRYLSARTDAGEGDTLGLQLRRARPDGLRFFIGEEQERRERVWCGRR